MDNNQQPQAPKVCQYTSNWEIQRQLWVGKGAENKGEEVFNILSVKVDDLEFIDDEPFLNMPAENGEALEVIKDTLKSTKRPYQRFDGYYKLEDIIE
jgi:hypothetical protein